jgi:hypothetical protein
MGGFPQHLLLQRLPFRNRSDQKMIFHDFNDGKQVPSSSWSVESPFSMVRRELPVTVMVTVGS